MTQHAYGRRAPKHSPALKLGPLLTGIIPPHPTTQDNLSPLSGWKMLGNDAAGDCVSVTWANFRKLVTNTLAGHETYPTQDQVWALYKTQNPDFDPNGDQNSNGPGSSADRGMEIQTVLEYLVNLGGPDGVKAVAFAEVDYTNVEELKAAHAIFGGVWYGINVLQANETEFDQKRPWDLVAGSPTLGGHSVLGGGYKGATASDVTFITWAEETTFTDRFITNGGVEEAWVVIWPEHFGSKQFTDGIDLTTLAADYKALTGRTLVVPDTPTPAPTPTSFPIAAVQPWLDSHLYTAKGKTARAAIKAWLQAGGK